VKTLLVFDDKNYTEHMPVCEKFAARGVILRGGKLAVQKSRAGECKILGGGMEPTEDAKEALYREVLEEAGLFIKQDTIRSLGTISEMREDIFKKGSKFVCHTTYYQCEILEETTEPNMTQSEIEKGFHLEWYTPDEIILNNQPFLHQPWIKRDTAFLQLLVEGELDIKMDEIG
jgi:8-oxo-dGTP pyrophosphatase MutT (NUDIX family)